MKMNKLAKITTALFVIAMIITACGMVFASSMALPSIGTSIPSGLPAATSTVLAIVQYVCYAAALLMLMVLGVKFISASPEGKAEIKKSAIIYVVGAVLVFAAATIVGWIKDFKW